MLAGHNPLAHLCFRGIRLEAGRIRSTGVVRAAGCLSAGDWGTGSPRGSGSGKGTRRGVFNHTEGIVEDAATGTAAGPLACYLAKYGRISSRATVTIEQGYTLTRPGRIGIRLLGDEVCIFDAGVTVAEGTLRL